MHTKNKELVKQYQFLNKIILDTNDSSIVEFQNEILSELIQSNMKLFYKLFYGNLDSIQDFIIELKYKLLDIDLERCGKNVFTALNLTIKHVNLNSYRRNFNYNISYDMAQKVIEYNKQKHNPNFNYNEFIKQNKDSKLLDRIIKSSNHKYVAEPKSEMCNENLDINNLFEELEYVIKPKELQLLKLRFQYGCEYTQIAKILGYSSQKSVEQVYRRCLDKIRSNEYFMRRYKRLFY